MSVQLIALLCAALLAVFTPRELLRRHLYELHAMAVVSLVIGIGGLILQMLFAPKPKDQYGARLSDVNVAAVSPGNPIIRHWGIMKLPLQVIWVSKIKETAHTESQSGGGKGMGGGGATSTTYTYSVDVAVAVCQGPVYRIRRIYANQKILWVDPSIASQLAQQFHDAYVAEATRLYGLGVDADNAYVGGFFFAFNNYQTDNEADLNTQANALAYIMANPIAGMPNPNSGNVNSLLGQMLSGLTADNDYPATKQRYDAISVYLGDQSQLPNSVMESYKGVGNVPAYRGTAYFVLQNLQLEDFGQTVPTFQAEVEKQNGTVYLSDILTDICAESGMLSDEYDARSGIGMVDDPPVVGFAVTQVTAGRSVIQDLMKVYPFDACESGFRLKFDWINRRPHTILRPEDFGAHVDTEDMPPTEEMTRTADFDLPKQIKLNFQEPARNYSKNTMYAARQVLTQANAVDEIDITIAMTRAEAKQRAEQTLVNRFMARRTVKRKLPKKYVVLEPGDICTVPDKYDPDYFEQFRTMEINVGANGIIEGTFIDHHYGFPVTAATEDDIIVAGDDDPQTLPVAGRTRAYMLDLPLLTDTVQDAIGYYVVLAQTKPYWGGGFLILDLTSGASIPVFGTDTTPTSAGSNWVTVAHNTTRTVHGYALQQLAPATPGIWDRASIIDVMMVDVSMIFQPAAEFDCLQNAINIIVVGDEIIQFADVQELGNGMWRLSTLLRGLRGTEWAMSTHVKGDRVVKLSSLNLNRVAHDQKYLNIAGSYKALTEREDSSNETAFTFANTGRSLQPYSPDIRHPYRNTAGDLTIDWEPRNRQNGTWLSGQDLTLDQATEAYEIDVYNSAGTAVVKTYSFGAVRTWSYTAAAQATDIGSAPTNLKLAIYQIGSIIGRGFPAIVTVTKP